jgi:hypothetical protein
VRRTAILGAGWLVLALGGCSRGKEAIAREQAQAIAQSLRALLDARNNPTPAPAPGQRPASPFASGPDGESPKDPWGTPYEIIQGTQAGTWLVRSWGPDRTPDTDDDIVSR